MNLIANSVRKKNKYLMVSCLMFLLPGIVVSQQTQQIYLSGKGNDNTVDWEFQCTEGRKSGYWTTIPVPSNWECKGFGTYNYGHDWKNKDMTLGKEHGFYRHTFVLPASWKGKTVDLVFDGSMTDTKVKINGKSAGEMHQGAFYRFKYDVSKQLRYGRSNLLEVDVAKHSANESVNEAQRKCDFWIFGGIFRPVYLEAKPKEYIDGVEIDAKADGTFRLNAYLKNTDKANMDTNTRVYGRGAFT